MGLPDRNPVVERAVSLIMTHRARFWSPVNVAGPRGLCSFFYSCLRTFYLGWKAI